MVDRNHEQDLRSYGRRRGRTPSARRRALWKDLLPLVSVPTDAASLRHLPRVFLPAVEDVWLEIGFGGGEHLIWQAKQRPSVGFVGCEPFEDGVAKLLDAVDLEGISNIRICAGDARPLLRLLPAGSIGRVFILFPDPWPKKRHHKRRLISPETLSELARVMRAGAELRIATDAGDYVCAILSAVAGPQPLCWTAASPNDWRQRGPDWPATRYEKKAVDAGRRCYFFRFKRV